MKYIEFSIKCTSAEAAEIMMAELGDAGFDSFQQESAALKAYISTGELGTNLPAIEKLLSGVDYTRAEMEERNWNSLWESNFEPVEVDGRCLIRAPFHESKGSEYEVVIMPRMSFGTGHHATTSLMTSAIIDHDFTGQRGLDMGSGTGILAILAVKRGAEHVDAIDIDEWAYENSLDNISTNGVEGRVTPMQGDASLIEGRSYDFILANINRNILLADMERYVASLVPGGLLIVSGILEGDVDAIVSHAASLGLKQERVRLRDGWAAVELRKG